MTNSIKALLKEHLLETNLQRYFVVQFVQVIISVVHVFHVALVPFQIWDLQKGVVVRRNQFS